MFAGNCLQGRESVLVVLDGIRNFLERIHLSADTVKQIILNLLFGLRHQIFCLLRAVDLVGSLGRIIDVGFAVQRSLHSISLFLQRRNGRSVGLGLLLDVGDILQQRPRQTARSLAVLNVQTVCIRIDDNDLVLTGKAGKLLSGTAQLLNLNRFSHLNIPQIN